METAPAVALDKCSPEVSAFSIGLWLVADTHLNLMLFAAMEGGSAQVWCRRRKSLRVAILGYRCAALSETRSPVECSNRAEEKSLAPSVGVQAVRQEY